MFGIDDDDPIEAIFNDVNKTSVVNTPASSNSMKLSAPASASETSANIDDFLSEVFGESLMSQPVIKSSVVNDDIAETGTAEVKYVAVATISSGDSNSNDKLSTILSTEFPDIDELRKHLLSIGRIPSSSRLRTWCILLSGNNSFNDNEAETWKIMNSFEVNFKDDIIQQCTNIFVDICSSMSCNCNGNGYIDTDKGQLEQAKLLEDIIDIFALHCIRHNIDYTTHHNNDSNSKAAEVVVGSTDIYYILYPILTMQLQQIHNNSNPLFTRSELSTLFYILYSQFYPLVTVFQSSSKDLAVYIISNWVKLLVSYHAPEVVVKLDKLYPLWFHIMVAGSTDSNSADSSDSSLPNSSNNSGGLIKLSWILGYFCEHIPLECSCKIMDWCVMLRDCYFGIYMIAALFVIYGDSILKMKTSEELTHFFHEGIYRQHSEHGEWFKILPISALPGGTIAINSNNDMMNNDSIVDSKVPSSLFWDSFTNGWINAANSLRNSTPLSFLTALEQLKPWCEQKISLLKRHQGIQTIATENNTTNSMEITMKAYLKQYITLHQSPLLQPSTQSLVKCIYVSAEEVIPSLCSSTNKLRLTQSQQAASNNASGSISHDDPITAFHIVTSEPTNTDPSSYFPETKPTTHWDKLLYFAVDCRTNEQKVLGRFPKAYAFDSTILSVTSSSNSAGTELNGNTPLSIAGTNTTADASTVVTSIVELLDTLGPLCEYSHLCLLDCVIAFYSGAGSNWYNNMDRRRNVSNTTSSSKQPPQIAAAQSTNTTNTALQSTALFASNLFTTVKTLSTQVAQNITNNTTNLLNQIATPAPVIEYGNNIDKQLPQVAQFLIERYFRHVAILRGGFSAALRYITRPETPYDMDLVLVDVNKGLLREYLDCDKSLAEICVPLLPPSPPNATVIASSSDAFDSSATGAAVRRRSGTSGISTSGASTSTTTDNVLDSIANFGVSVAGFVNKNVSNASSTTTGSSSAVTTNSTGITADSSPSANDTATPNSSSGTDSSGTSSSTRQLFGNIGRRLSTIGSQSIENIKKGVTVIASELEKRQQQVQQQQLNKSNQSNTDPFGIFEDVNTSNNNSNALNKSEKDKQLALTMHQLSGLQVGETITISRNDLPGAVLFPALVFVLLKNKQSKENDAVSNETISESERKTDSTATIENTVTNNTSNVLLDMDVNSSNVSSVNTQQPQLENNKAQQLCQEQSNQQSAQEEQSEEEGLVPEHRFLAVTHERFLILDAQGGGVGCAATVEANHHLTELIKITFRKKDPELVNIFFLDNASNAGKNNATSTAEGLNMFSKQFRIVRRKEFVDTLQRNMMKFR